MPKHIKRLLHDIYARFPWKYVLNSSTNLCDVYQRFSAADWYVHICPTMYSAGKSIQLLAVHLNKMLCCAIITSLLMY